MKILTNFFCIILLFTSTVVFKNYNALSFNKLKTQTQLPIMIINKATNFCLTSQIGEYVNFEKCSNKPSQLWLENFDDFNSMILINYENSLILSDIAQNQEVQILKGNDNQLWHGDVSRNSENFFTIQNKLSLNCLSINSDPHDNKSISTYCNTEDDLQLFIFKIPEQKIQQKKNVGQFLIQNFSGLCVTRTTPPRLSECNAELNQLWLYNQPKKSITSLDEKDYLKFSNDNLQVEITNSTNFEDKTTKFFGFKTINDNIIIENINSEEKCLGTSEEDIYDPKVIQVDCKSVSKFQQFKFIDVSSYDYFANEFYKNTEKYPFAMKNVYLKNLFSETCLKFDGKNKPILHEACKNAEEFQWKANSFGKDNFYFTTMSEKYLLISRRSMVRGVELFVVENSEDLFDNLTLQFFKLKNVNLFFNYQIVNNDFDLCTTLNPQRKKVSMNKCFDTDKEQYINIVTVDSTPLVLNDKGIIPPYSLPFA